MPYTALGDGETFEDSLHAALTDSGTTRCPHCGATAPVDETSLSQMAMANTKQMPSAITTSQCQRLHGSRSSRAGISLSITPTLAFAFTPVKMGRSRSGMYYCNSILLIDMVLPFNVPVTFTLMSLGFFRSAINFFACWLLA